MGRRTVTMAETMVSMTFAMAEMTALMAAPMAETPAPFEPDRPDLALVQLRRVREAARERGEAPLRARGTGAGLAGAMAGTTSAGRERQVEQAGQRPQISPAR